ncbi:MAG: 50S ribosomal protein L9 [Phycisphaeraceae bacterium]|nr:50S ribosomal protein L9 [Phycisphaerales bacterium]MCB9861376.1 50S ribosomal protein L9 [Phycisphaeraceae bacterium]
MATKNIKLLLTENVDNLGIVGDVVNVRLGYARNYLLPRSMAMQPSKEAIEALAAKRAEAEKMMAELRKQREQVIGKLEGFEMTMSRSCNEQGILYGAVTQNDIASGLKTLGYQIKPREVRLPYAIKRIDNYDVQVKFANDLLATIKVHVVPDREIDLDDKTEDMEFDNEGNLIEKTASTPAEAKSEG